MWRTPLGVPCQRLISTPFRSGDTNVDAARLGACVTKGLMSILREGLTINE